MGYQQWLGTSSYPTNVFGQSCITNLENIYCIGGVNSRLGDNDNSIYYASILNSGEMGAWLPSSNPYPTNVEGQSCITYSDYVYCIGGALDSNWDNSIYYAQILPSGDLGTWQPASNSYPTNVVDQSCILYSNGAMAINNIYCIAGASSQVGLDNATYYAPILGPGVIGAWLPTNSYPTNVFEQSCILYSNNSTATGNIYCIAGLSNQNGLDDSIYYAPILNSGAIGLWLPTTSYPTRVYEQSCVTNSNNIYCAGGFDENVDSDNYTYYAPILSSGAIGPWQPTTSYPVSGDSHSCVTNSENIYCVGGLNNNVYPTLYYNSVYYATISGSGIGNTLNYSFKVSSPTTSNFKYKAIVTDSSPIPLTVSSTTNTITVINGSAIVTTTTIPNGGGGGNGNHEQESDNTTAAEQLHIDNKHHELQQRKIPDERPEHISKG